MNKLFKSIITLTVAGMLFSCGEEKKEAAVEETTPAKDSATSMQIETPKAEEKFTPFDVVEIRHNVKDFAKWKSAFDTDSTERMGSGLEQIVVAKNLNKPENVYIALKASDLKKAKDFAAAPRLKDVMDKAGVSSKPEVRFLHVIRFNPDAKEKTWVVVTHKVKDFDAWLKVFDGEGTAARAEQGLYDAVMARDVDDPNTVMLVFDIKDLEKAKKAMMSEDKKKLMMSAGVEGVPSIEFYHDAE